jgi:hypothetical protein
LRENKSESSILLTKKGKRGVKVFAGIPKFFVFALEIVEFAFAKNYVKGKYFCHGNCEKRAISTPKTATLSCL